MKINITAGYDEKAVIGTAEINDGEFPEGVVLAPFYESKEPGLALIGFAMTADKDYLGFLLNELHLTNGEAAHVIELLTAQIKKNEKVAADAAHDA